MKQLQLDLVRPSAGDLHRGAGFVTFETVEVRSGLLPRGTEAILAAGESQAESPTVTAEAIMYQISH
jgi:hypothetical protein